MQLRMILKQWGGYGIALAVLVWLIGSGPGWYHLLRLRKQVVTLRRAVVTLQQERDALHARAQRFDESTEPATARFARLQHAREVLQLGKPGEVVYRKL